MLRLYRQTFEGSNFFVLTEETTQKKRYFETGIRLDIPGFIRSAVDCNEWNYCGNWTIRWRI